MLCPEYGIPNMLKLRIWATEYLRFFQSLLDLTKVCLAPNLPDPGNVLSLVKNIPSVFVVYLSSYIIFIPKRLCKLK
jgi:hypothetical protein